MVLRNGKLQLWPRRLRIYGICLLVVERDFALRIDDPTNAAACAEDARRPQKSFILLQRPLVISSRAISLQHFFRATIYQPISASKSGVVSRPLVREHASAWHPSFGITRTSLVLIATLRSSPGFGWRPNGETFLHYHLLTVDIKHNACRAAVIMGLNDSRAMRDPIVKRDPNLLRANHRAPDTRPPAAWQTEAAH